MRWLLDDGPLWRVRGVLNPPRGSSPPAHNTALSGGTWPDAPQTYPANLVPQPSGEFTSADGWTTHAGLTIDTVAGVAKWDGTQATIQQFTNSFTEPLVTGRQYGFLTALSAWTSGAAPIGAGTPGGQLVLGTAPNDVRHMSRLMTSIAAYTKVRFPMNPGSVVDIDYVRVYDLTALKAKKWRIVPVLSQSNWVGTEDAADRLLNDLPEPRALVIPSIEMGNRGSVLDANGLGEPMLLVDPVMHMTNSFGGPAGAFARTFCDGLRDDEVLVYVATGYAGGGRMAPDAVWSRENNGVAWANMLKQVDGALAKAPAGSSVAGLMFCQGEADLTVNTGDAHTTLIRGDIEFLRERWGNFPVVVNEIGWALSTGRAGLENMIASQAKLDSNSGDPLALPRCTYIPRPAGSVFQADELHYAQVTQRVRGALAANALLALQYGGAKPVLPPAVSVPTPQGYPGTTATVTDAGEVTINNASHFLGDNGLGAFHYFVRADNMLGKTLTVKRATDGENKGGGDLSQWQMAWAYNPDGEWFAFDSVSATAWILTAANTAPLTQSTVYIARRPVFTIARWDAAISRWVSNSLTRPTASGNAQYVVGRLPTNTYAPAVDCYGFAFGTGPAAIVLTGNIHTGEHVGAYSMEGCVDWLLGDDPKAVALRSKCTFYVYPAINPQGRYAGAQRAEVTTGGGTMNSNRIWWPEADFDHVPLSKVMRDAFHADLPATIASYYDFHDTAVNASVGLPPLAARGFAFERNAGVYMGLLRAEYFTRTGAEVTIEPTAGGPTIGTYFTEAHGAAFGLAVEHQLSNTVSIPEWQQWGRDVGHAIHDYYGDAPKWIIPAWSSSASEVVENNGAVTVSRADGNPLAAFAIPEGKTIEIIVDLTLVNSQTLYLRQSLNPGLAIAESTELHGRTSTSAPYRRVQTVTWTADRPYFGIIIARQNTSNPAAFTLSNMVRYRVLP